MTRIALLTSAASCHDADGHPASRVLSVVHGGMCGRLQLAGMSRLVVACKGQELQRSEGGLAGRGLDQAVWGVLRWQGSRSGFRCSMRHGRRSMAERALADAGNVIQKLESHTDGAHTCRLQMRGLLQHALRQVTCAQKQSAPYACLT